jgi:glycosyltransferase involved in cell wall biosynthesis
MKLALLHYSVPPVVGGVESVLAQHARLMADAGHDVRVIAGRGGQFDPRIAFISMPLADSHRAEVLDVKSELDAGRVPPVFAALVDMLRAELARALAGVDVLIAHNVCSLNKNLALTAALHDLHAQAGAPRMILWHHDLAWTTPRYRPELHEGWPWDLLRTDWPATIQVAVSTLRQQELAALLRVPLERIHVVPNGLDVTTFLKLEAHTTVLVRRLNLLAAEPLLLLPVRITTRKNIELAVRVIAALRNPAQWWRARLPNPVLVVTGPPGPHNPANAAYFARLKELRAALGLETSVHYLAELVEGYLPDTVIADFYRLADALFMPSREEGFGIPVLEAGLSRLPIFCTDIPPLRELAGDRATYFSPDGPPEHIASLVANRLAADPNYAMGVHVRSAYTWEGVYAQRIAPLLAPSEGRSSE